MKKKYEEKENDSKSKDDRIKILRSQLQESSGSILKLKEIIKEKETLISQIEKDKENQKDYYASLLNESDEEFKSIKGNVNVAHNKYWFVKFILLLNYT